MKLHSIERLAVVLLFVVEKQFESMKRRWHDVNQRNHISKRHNNGAQAYEHQAATRMTANQFDNGAMHNAAMRIVVDAVDSAAIDAAAQAAGELMIELDERMDEAADGQHNLNVYACARLTWIPRGLL